jgi:hypothetical protein
MKINDIDLRYIRPFFKQNKNLPQSTKFLLQSACMKGFHFQSRKAQKLASSTKTAVSNGQTTFKRRITNRDEGDNVPHDAHRLGKVHVGDERRKEEREQRERS